MTLMGRGGWERLTELDFTSSDVCPSGTTWFPVTVDGVDYCTTVDGSEVATWTLRPKCPYSEIVGYVLADQKGKMEGFFRSHGEHVTVDDVYVDGVSITFGFVNSSSPRQHIFTFAAGREELARVESCPCHGAPPSTVPHFVQWDYHCDSTYAPYSSTPLSKGYRTLWSGVDCGQKSACCYSADAPWFYRRLPLVVRDQPIEVRIMSDAASHTDEMILVREIALYVR